MATTVSITMSAGSSFRLEHPRPQPTRARRETASAGPRVSKKQETLGLSRNEQASKAPYRVEDVLAFLKETQSSWRTARPEYNRLNLDDLYSWPYSPDLWPLENILQYQLERAKRDQAPDASIAYIRALIQTISMRTYEPVKEYDLRLQAQGLIGKNHPLHIRPEDATLIRDGLQESLLGDSMEPAALAIERVMADAWRDLKSWMDNGRGERRPDAITWTDLKRILFERINLDPQDLVTVLNLPNAAHALQAIEEIEQLRPLRDTIYARRSRNND